MNEFWNDQINVGYYDKIVKRGIRQGKGPRSYWHLTTLKKVSTYLIEDILHLDYACGPGTLIGKFSNSISTGVDLSKDQIEYAKKNYPKNAAFYTIEEFNFKKNEDKFDVITVLGLLEFLNDNDINELINNLNITLKKSGKIIFTTPNYVGITKVLEILQNKFGSVDYKEQHINKLNQKKINTVLEKNKDFDVRIKKFMNLSFVFSIFSHRFAWIIEKQLDKLFNGNFGSLLIVILTKKN